MTTGPLWECAPTFLSRRAGQARVRKAKSDYESVITSCQDQFTSRNQVQPVRPAAQF